MTTTLPSTPVTRREIVRNGAALGLLAPLGLGMAHVAAAQESGTDFSGHPAVGVWIEGGSGPTFAYNVVHADGTYVYYNPWLGNTAGNDPKLAAIGFGVWQPVGEREIEAMWRIAWLDTTVASLATLKGRLTIDEAGTHASGQYKARLVDAQGKVLLVDSGSAGMERMQLEPFDDPESSEATPES